MDMDKRYDHASCEQKARELWDREKIYLFVKDNRSVYSIDTPPPTVSGTLHIGHIFSYTHTDFVARYKRMQGYNVFYPMGFDDNGLPTERYVEKKHKTKAHLMKRSAFIELCLKETVEVEKMFEQLWRQMALSVDWTKIYFTISKESRKISQYSFIDLYNKGLAYRKQEPSLYCTTCRTSVAQAELDSIDVSTTFNDLEFETEDGEKIIIATTRPELLPACVAVFYHPDDDRYKHLDKKNAIIPFFKQKVKILSDDNVDPEKGTGLVMCCTFGDQTDIGWQKKYDLPFVQVVGLDGKWTEKAGPLNGLRVHEARKKMLELLQEEGKLVVQKGIVHSVNTHERCKQEIEYQILKQWFVNILDHKETFLTLADKINWKPAFMKARYKDWVNHLNWDWCISRQRFFGVPFPVWHCTECEKVILADVSDLPVDPQEQKFPGGKCPECNAGTIVPDSDVMDTWNTSSLTPQINAHWPEHEDISLPMSLRPQAHDIIRTWAFDTIVKSWYHQKRIPWNDIMISGHVLSGKEKISKSKGNQKMAPEVLLKEYPADVIRFWAARGKLGADTAFSENQLKIGQKLVTKLWNAFRFCKGHIQDYQPGETPASFGQLNEWLLHIFNQTLTTYKKQFDEYEYSHALDAIEKFFWHHFCDNYLELVKDQFFNPDEYDQMTVQATRFTLYEIGFGILQLYAPFLPHVTETLYQRIFKKQEKTVLLHATLLDSKRYDYVYEESVVLVNAVLDIVGVVRKLKSEKQLSLKTDVAQLIIYSDDQALLTKLEEQTRLITGVTKALAVTFVKQAYAQTALEEKDGKWLASVQVCSRDTCDQNNK